MSVKRPDGMGKFEFAVLASLRAAQLTRGCTPRVGNGSDKLIVTAQMEVSARKIERTANAVPASELAD